MYFRWSALESPESKWQPWTLVSGSSVLTDRQEFIWGTNCARSKIIACLSQRHKSYSSISCDRDFLLCVIDMDHQKIWKKLELGSWFSPTKCVLKWPQPIQEVPYFSNSDHSSTRSATSLELNRGKSPTTKRSKSNTYQKLRTRIINKSSSKKRIRYASGKRCNYTEDYF